MLKPTHKRPRGWVGVPSHELGFLLGQHFARPGFADCLCLSLYQSFVVVLAADLVSQKSSVSAKGAYNHRCACQRVTCSSICTVTYTACTVTYTAMHTGHTDSVRMESARVFAFCVPLTWLRSGESPGWPPFALRRALPWYTGQNKT